MEGNLKIAVVGLGYVGLPVLLAFAKNQTVVGYDKSNSRVDQLNSGYDKNNEFDASDLLLDSVIYTSDESLLDDCNFFIIAVPTPINSAKIPDLTILEFASATVGQHLNKGDCVVFESTVYPGVTEDVCVPILSQQSGLRAGVDFIFGYSPERINPGDMEHTFTKILKVVSGCNEEALNHIAKVYSSVVEAGVYRAESVKVAEAAKVIENTQRDINIALMNELSRIFTLMGVDTKSVLDAAGTKWNFLPFKPGLVGGHCIGVDPYYLTYCARQHGYHPEVILSGRRVNDVMGRHIAEEAILKLASIRGKLETPKVKVLGVTFKEDCNDIRNSKVFDIITRFREFGCQVNAEDPIAHADDVHACYGVHISSAVRSYKGYAQERIVSDGDIAVKVETPALVLEKGDKDVFDILVVAVAHQEYRNASLDYYRDQLAENALIVDVKGILPRAECESFQLNVWRM